MPVSHYVLAPDSHQVNTPGLLSQGLGAKGVGLGYGFQYGHGLVLPAVLAGGKTPFHLLRYLPTRLVEDTTKDVIFDYRIQDYYLAPRAEIPLGTETTPNANTPGFPKANGWGSPTLNVLSAHIDVVPPTPTSDTSSRIIRQLELHLELDNGHCIEVDVGQITRGHRYSYLAKGSDGRSLPNQTSAAAVIHDVSSVLLQDGGLITAKQGGFHVIPSQNPLVSLAVLGKLYPENVVLLPQLGSLSQAERAGKGLEPKFVIWGGVEYGGLRGSF